MSPGPDGTVLWGELLDGAMVTLGASVGSPGALEVRRIVAEAAGVELGRLGSVLDDPATERGVAHLDAMVARRGRGEPLQYVLGSWGFRHLELLVDQRVLIPRPETEQVVDEALAELDRLGGRTRTTTVVDLGTGSGAIALAIATERPRTEVWATDVDPGAAAVARANLAGTGRAAARVRVVEGDWFAALPAQLRSSVDLVVSNPPYVPDGTVLPDEVLHHEPARALYAGPEGTDALRHLLTGAGEWLRDEGALVCELSPEQGDEMAALARRSFAEVRLGRDLGGRVRCVVAARPRRRPRHGADEDAATG